MAFFSLPEVGGLPSLCEEVDDRASLRRPKRKSTALQRPASWRARSEDMKSIYGNTTGAHTQIDEMPCAIFHVPCMVRLLF